MHHIAKITGYKVTEDGTEFKILIPKVNLMEYIHRKMSIWCGLWLDDGRHITALQRKKIYATVRDISEYTGYLPEEQKEWLKYLHIARTGCQYFSLSSCSIDTAREFINTIMDHVIENGIQLSDLGINRTDDIGKYLYACLKHRKCCVCGCDGELHHMDTIGMGNNRRKIDDSDKRKIGLCRKHHSEAHTIGDLAFEEKYKVFGIILMEDREVA